MRWKLLFCCTIFLLLATAFPVLASSVVVTPIKNQITLSETATFEVSITNEAREKQRYIIYSLSQGWIVDPSPLKDKVIELGPRSNYTVKLVVTPLEEFVSGIYSIPIIIENTNTGYRHTEELKVYLAPDGPIDYLPSIKVMVDMDEKIDPRELVSIKMFLENRNPLDLKDLTIKIQSEMPEFVKEVKVDLPPLQKKTVEFTVAPNKFQQPKDYYLFFVFERNQQIVKIVEQKIEIMSLLPDFTAEVKEDYVFLKKFSQLTIHNEGNLLNEQEVKFPVSLWQVLFVQGAVKVKNIEGQRYLVWKVSLQPNEVVVLNFVTNYRLLLYLLLAILFFAGFYFYVQAPVALMKKAATTKSGSEGALSEIKVTLELRNKTKKLLKNVSVIDLVPAIANVEKSLQLGTLRPQEIKHTKKGTKVIWTLAELDAHEHRLITYRLKAKLNILGTFSLPRAIVEYPTRKDRKKKAYSNIFKLSA